MPIGADIPGCGARCFVFRNDGGIRRQLSLRFLRRVSVLPGVRLNFSRSGISTTIGVRGASVTLGGRYGTTANLGIPGSGLSLRVPLKSARGQSSSLPADNQPSTPAYTSIPIQAAHKPVPQMTPIQSDAVGNITTPGLTGLRDLIISAMQQRGEAEAAVSKAATLLAEWESTLANAQQRRNRAESGMRSWQLHSFDGLGKALSLPFKSKSSNLPVP